ncbi:MAG: GNAT family N-acetyltransferase [Candidatus Competibacterales bacterium]
MRIESVPSLEDVDPNAWNRLNRDHYPFLRHEFLVALERHGCVGEAVGWVPCHLLCYRDDELVGAAPLYIKYHYLGEFIFDHAWEAAYRRVGLPYYPKLVGAIPFTPATGQRLLAAPDDDRSTIAAALAAAAKAVARQLDASSVHWLFPVEEDQRLLCGQGYLQRLGCQFHWTNRGYGDFEDFLGVLSSKKRKNIKRERRTVAEAGLSLEVFGGTELDAPLWQVFHDFYVTTFEKRWGYPTMTLGFFREIGRTMGEQLVLPLARDPKGQPVAGAICYRSDTTLYGRHWGCLAEYNHLHFETCYYQGIDYCIRHGLTHFEPGAQGEHKISRGFLPTLTHSAHWLAHPEFHRAVADFLDREGPAVRDYAKQLFASSPYRAEEVPTL